MRVPPRTVLLATAVSVVLGSATAVAATERRGGRDGDLSVIGLAGGGTRLVGFDVDRPERSHRIGHVRGLVGGDQRLVGIDFRVQDGSLLGVGDKGGVYVLDPRSATAKRTTNPALPLDGSPAYGVDVNPAANALRVISANGQNLRLPLATPGSAAVVDTPLTRPAVAPATGTVPATGLTGAAYTNNDLDAATATTLFDIDTERDQVTVQSPANAGSTAPTGALGFDARTDTGFDVYSSLRKGRTTALQAFAASGGRLYSVDLLTGAADSLGRLGDSEVTDIALPLGQD